LDEISEISLNTQAKLLRVLQEKEIMRVGSNKNIPVDVRVIAATNADLSKAIKEGKFREDLFYRLSILPIYIPPLRDRKEDIPLLVKSFIAKFNDEYGRNIVDISEEALRILQSHDWPGNVRELENTIGRAIIYMNINEKVIDTIHLPHFNKKKSPVDDRVIAYEEADSLESVLSKTEAEYIKKLYYKLDKNKTRTAKELGISIRSLYYKMEKYGIS
jgi:transcriptional regulator with PAS, ATPase and Fis domain